jgi:hypothetical protein
MAMAKKKDKPTKKVEERGDAETTAKNVLDTIKMIQTKFGEGSIMKMGDTPKVNIDVIPTGSLGLDAALRYRRSSKRKNHRNLWTRIFW